LLGFAVNNTISFQAYRLQRTDQASQRRRRGPDGFGCQQVRLANLNINMGQAQEADKNYGIPFVEMSEKTQMDIDEAFNTLVRGMRKDEER
jgi:hypothetical protein